MLVGAEVALALVLLTGAGLPLRTLWGMQSVERGFSADRIGLATVSLPAGGRRSWWCEPPQIRRPSCPPCARSCRRSIHSCRCSA